MGRELRGEESATVKIRGRSLQIEGRTSAKLLRWEPVRSHKEETRARMPGVK